MVLTKHIIFIFCLRNNATFRGGLWPYQGGRVGYWLIHFTYNTRQEFLLNPNKRRRLIGQQAKFINISVIQHDALFWHKTWRNRNGQSDQRIALQGVNGNLSWIMRNFLKRRNSRLHKFESDWFEKGLKLLCGCRVRMVLFTSSGPKVLFISKTITQSPQVWSGSATLPFHSSLFQSCLLPSISFKNPPCLLHRNRRMYWWKRGAIVWSILCFCESF